MSRNYLIIFLSLLILGCHLREEKKPKRIEYSWSKLKNNINFTASALCVYNKYLYAAGYYGLHNKEFPMPIAKWDDSSWTYIDNPHNTIFTRVQTMVVYKNELYIGTNYMIKGNDEEKGGIFKWNGFRWSKVGELKGVYEVINNKTSKLTEFQIGQLFVYRNELFLGGEFRGIDSVPSHNIIRWDGDFWKPVVNGANGEICAFGVYHNELYISGFFDTIDSKPIYHIARWDGNEYYTVGKKISANAEIFHFSEFDDTLFVGGHFFDSAGGIYVENIAKWDGNRWSKFKRGTDNNGGASVGPFIEYQKKLIASGEFDSIAGVSAKNIVVYDHNHWDSAGALPGNFVWSFAQYHDELYASGSSTPNGPGGIFKLIVRKYY